MSGADPFARPTRTLAADAAGIAEAARLIRAGGLVALPTETVYGLGADATDGRVVAGIYAAKGRPSFNPLIAHVGEPDQALALGRFDAAARRLAEAFWPGPLTLVVPMAPGAAISDLTRAGLDTVGLRVPAHPVARALLNAVGRPVAAPSANRSGHVSPTTAAHVLADLHGRIDAVLDAGATPVGVESTIVACLGGDPVLLRPGGLPRAALEEVKGPRQTLVFFESGPRLKDSLADMAAVLGPRPAAVARELTKLYETLYRGRLSALAADPALQAAKGEIVVLIGPGEAAEAGPEEIDAACRETLAELPADLRADVGVDGGLPLGRHENGGRVFVSYGRPDSTLSGWHW